MGAELDLSAALLLHLMLCLDATALMMHKEEKGSSKKTLGRGDYGPALCLPDRELLFERKCVLKTDTG